MKLSSQFFQPLSSNTRYRKRIGRGGRIFIDRAGYKSNTLSSGGKTKPGLSEQERHLLHRYDFDSDSSQEDSDIEIDEMNDR